jgi:hypothetical protein
VYQLAQKGGLWLMLTLIGAAVMIVIGLGSFSHLMAPTLRWALAVLPAVVFFAVGMLSGSGETIVRTGSGENERNLIVAPVFSTWMAYFIGCGMVVFYIVLAFRRIHGAEWLVTPVLGLFLIAAGYHLIPLLRVLRLWLRRVWDILVQIVHALGLLLIHAARFIVVVLEHVTYLFAAPLDKILSPRSPKPST